MGLGPFAGVLGIALHTWGSAAKFFADHIENANLGPFDAVRTTGAGRLTTIAYALVPDVLPVLLSTTLFWWKFNVRASTVLGVVGAGGIGQELKNSMDLLDFARLFTIIAVILVVVTALDQFSGWLRRRLALPCPPGFAPRCRSRRARLNSCDPPAGRRRANEDVQR